MEKLEMMLVLKAVDAVITAVFSIIKAIKTDDAEVQAKKDELIARMKALADYEPPVEPE